MTVPLESIDEYRDIKKSFDYERDIINLTENNVKVLKVIVKVLEKYGIICLDYTDR